MRGGSKTEFLYRQNDLLMNSDVEFAKFLSTRNPRAVLAEAFKESIPVTLTRRYDRETEQKLKQIRGAHLAQLREQMDERKSA